MIICWVFWHAFFLCTLFIGSLTAALLVARWPLFLNSIQDLVLSRSSRLQMFFKIFVLKNFAIFTTKHLCWRLFEIKLLAWRSGTFHHRCFPVSLAKFLRTVFYRTSLEAAPGIHITHFFRDLLFKKTCKRLLLF